MRRSGIRERERMTFEDADCSILFISVNAQTYRETYRFEARQSSAWFSKMPDFLYIPIACSLKCIYY